MSSSITRHEINSIESMSSALDKIAGASHEKLYVVKEKESGKYFAVAAADLKAETYQRISITGIKDLAMKHLSSAALTLPDDKFTLAAASLKGKVGIIHQKQLTAENSVGSIFKQICLKIVQCVMVPFTGFFMLLKGNNVEKGNQKSMKEFSELDLAKYQLK